MKTQPLVSIIIPNYNYAHFLPQAIDSALKQSYPFVQVVVVDDGSTDNSIDIIKSYGTQVTPVIKSNGGQASALNAGFSSCKGEIICLLDADDLFLPEKVSEVVQFFQSSRNIGWVFTESAPVRTENLTDANLAVVYKNVFNKDSKASPKKIDFRENIRNGELPNFTPSTSNLCFSRNLAEKIFPLPEIRGLSGVAISDLYMKLLAVGLDAGCVLLHNLGIFRTHNNLYSTLDINKKRGFFAEINITTGYWIRANFPELTKISMKIISKGFAAYMKSNYLRDRQSDADYQAMMKNYLSNITLAQKYRVCGMVAYYFLKLFRKKIV